MPSEEFRLKVRLNISEDLKEKLSGGLEEAIKKGEKKKKKALEEAGEKGKKKKDEKEKEEEKAMGLGDLLVGLGEAGLGRLGGGRMLSNIKELMSSGVAKIGVIIALVTGLVMMAKKAFGFLQESSPALKTVVDLFRRSFMMVLKPIGDLLALILAPILVFFYRYFLIPFYQEIYPLIREFLKSIDPKVFEILGAVLAGLAVGMLAFFALITMPIFNMVILLNAIVKAYDWLKGAFGRFTDWLGNAWDRFVSWVFSLGGRMSGFWTSVRDRLQRFWEKIIDFWSLLQKFWKSGENIQQKLIELKEKVVDRLMEWGKKIWDRLVEIKDRFVQVFGSFAETVLGVVRKVWDWLKGGLTILLEKIVHLGGWILVGIGRIVEGIGRIVESLTGGMFGGGLVEKGEEIKAMGEAMKSFEVNVYIDTYLGNVDEFINRLSNELARVIRAEGG